MRMKPETHMKLLRYRKFTKKRGKIMHRAEIKDAIQIATATDVKICGTA